MLTTRTGTLPAAGVNPVKRGGPAQPARTAGEKERREVVDIGRKYIPL